MTKEELARQLENNIKECYEEIGRHMNDKEMVQWQKAHISAFEYVLELIEEEPTAETTS